MVLRDEPKQLPFAAPPFVVPAGVDPTANLLAAQALIANALGQRPAPVPRHSPRPGQPFPYMQHHKHTIHTQHMTPPHPGMRTSASPASPPATCGGVSAPTLDVHIERHIGAILPAAVTPPIGGVTDYHSESTAKRTTIHIYTLLSTNAHSALHIPTAYSTILYEPITQTYDARRCTALGAEHCYSTWRQQRCATIATSSPLL